MGRKDKLIEELGEMTAAAARDEDRQADVAKVTGLTEATVRRRLNGVSHGKTLIRNVFEDHWPDAEHADAITVGGMTAASARDNGMQAVIAQITGLAEATIRRRLNEVSHGKTLVRNVFEDHWPLVEPEEEDEEGDAAEDDEPEDDSAVDADALGEMTVTAARSDERHADIAKVTGLSRAYVRERLNDVFHGKKLIRNVFGDHWPDAGSEEEAANNDVDADTLGEMTAAVARADNRQANIARVTGLSDAVVCQRLTNVSHGNKLVRKVFEAHWPSSKNERKSSNATSGSFQGRADHQRMQKILFDLGRLSRFQVRTNHPIGAGFKPDVLWFRLNPSEHSNAAPFAVFEIEFGSAQAIAKSLSSLKHAFDLGAQRLFLILPSGRVEGAKLRLRGAFHEIAQSIDVLPIEDTIELGLVDLAEQLRI